MTNLFLSNIIEVKVLVDPSNPFYLHHSNHPRIILVTKPLNNDIYDTENCSMSIALGAKNKTSIFDILIKRSPSIDVRPHRKGAMT